MIDSDSQAKEDLLKAEIIDKKYNEDDFVSFCASKKEGADDLTKWSLEELKEVITEFQQAYPKKAPEETATEEKKVEEEIKEDINNIKEGAKVEEKKTKNITINCKKLDKSKLNEVSSKLKIEVKNAQQIDGGLLSQSYINYEVETAIMEWKVRRRFSDFEWLRQTIIRYHPGKVVPPLPNKKMGARRFEADFIEKRMGFLQKFMNELIRVEEFLATEPLNAFLSMTDRSQFEAKMKELTSYQRSPYIEEMKTFSGTIVIAAEEEDNEKYFTNISNYYRIQNQLYDRLNFNLKNFYSNFGLAIITLQDVQKDFETLRLLNDKVSMKEQITKSYEELGVFFKNWMRILNKQNEIVKKYIRTFFKFQAMEGGAYVELINNRELLRKKYVDENARLYAKKEKLWTQMDLSKWEIIDDRNLVDQSLLKRDKIYALSKMCTKETTILNNMKYQLGFANKSNIDELKNIIRTNSKLFLSHLNEFLNEFYPTLTDGINVYSIMQMFINSYDS